MKVVQLLQSTGVNSRIREVTVYEGDSRDEALAAVARALSFSSPWHRLLSVALVP